MATAANGKSAPPKAAKPAMANQPPLAEHGKGGHARLSGQATASQGAVAERRPARKHPVVTKAEYCLVVVPDGDAPTLEIFPDIASLARRLRSLEGQEFSVFPFFGIPMPFTAGPDRFLQLPEGQPYPLFDFAGYGHFVPNPNATLPVDDSYFMASGEREERPDSAVVDHRPMAGPGNCREPERTRPIADRGQEKTAEQQASKQPGPQTE
jgi:hypothetical protein